MRTHVNARGGFGIPTSSSSNGSGHNSFNQRLGLKLNDYATSIELIFANLRSSGSGGGILNGESAITLTCALEIGSLIVPVFWPNGSRSIRIEPGAFVRSLKVPVSAAPNIGATVLRMHGIWDSAPASIPIANGAMGDAAPGYDSNTRGIDLADATLGTMPTSINTFGVIFPPWAVIGATATPGPAVLAIGDSNRSWSTSGLAGATVRFINLGADGYTLDGFMAPYPRLLGIEEAGISHALVTIAGGDVTAGAGAQTLIGRAVAARTILERYGIKAVMATTPPKTNAANTQVNSVSIWNAVRDYNEYLRASNGVGYGFFDLFDQWGIRETGLWRSDLGTPTDDGTHANAVMHTAAAAALSLVAPGLFV